MKRFVNCNEWFKWIISRLASDGMISYSKPEWLAAYNVKAADASGVVEKGRSGRTYRLRFALELFTMHSASHRITGMKAGESLMNFDFSAGDLVAADRITARSKALPAVKAAGRNSF